MSYPKVRINTEKLSENLEYMSHKLKAGGLSFTAVTKVFSAHPEMMEIFEKCEGIEYFGDSRIINLKSYKESKKKKILIRICMPSEVEDVVKYADISFHSEMKTVILMNDFASKINKKHQILLMIDLGDLREGFYYEEDLMAAVKQIKKLSHIQIIGIGVNLTCYGAVIPEEKNLEKLLYYKTKIEEILGYRLDMISGGNSSSLYLLDDESQNIPEGINNLRIGEALVLGKETAFGKALPGMNQDVFELTAELIEVKEKPSLPTGKIGMDAFGHSPTFEDKGIMLRGIVALGKQDVSETAISPKDQAIEILGASSDHLILDLTHSDTNYQVGDKIAFKLDYGSLLSCFTSKYVMKDFYRY
ncbi:ornithine racemase Orr [Vagococcus elongatus]|uniref:Alanine racemase n=1 Tax=Vagococcus elongatus TaxID=180344 RepID=A0A430B5F5_9ENTE|nr:ornithine racemase Orr [Vagococcus elongatus]RSU15600.1 alanine racemase [Vagococcus elongatus]